MSRAFTFLAVLVVALGLGAVGLYAHQRTIMEAKPAVFGCPSGDKYYPEIGKCAVRERLLVPILTPAECANLAPSERIVDGLNWCTPSWYDWRFTGATPRIEVRPAVRRTGFSGPLGRDSAPFWWYGAGGLLLLGSVATFTLVRPARRPGATLDP